MRFFEVVGQLILRLGLFAITTFLAVCLGLMDYILVNEFLYLLNSGHAGQLGFEFDVLQGIELFVAGTVIIALSCGTVGIFGWGFLCIFEELD